MRWCLLILVGLLGGGCDKRQPKLSDEVVSRIEAGFPGIKRACLEELRMNGFEGRPERTTEDCFEMTEAQRWTGLWRNEFEGSLFCVAPARQCAAEDYRTGAWLSWAGRPNPRGELYRVDFIGRRTAHAGRFGHGGLMPHEVIVDHMIRIEKVE